MARLQNNAEYLSFIHLIIIQIIYTTAVTFINFASYSCKLPPFPSPMKDKQPNESSQSFHIKIKFSNKSSKQGMLFLHDAHLLILPSKSKSKHTSFALSKCINVFIDRITTTGSISCRKCDLNT